MCERSIIGREADKLSVKSCVRFWLVTDIVCLCPLREPPISFESSRVESSLCLQNDCSVDLHVDYVGLGI